MVLIGGPIDPRVNPTARQQARRSAGMDWFRAIASTPCLSHAGMGRRVYPGFLQLSGFMSMNFERHISAHLEMFNHLVEGDGDSAERHRDFYDEYLAVMDLTAEFYLQTVDRVFVRHQVPLGLLRHRGNLIDLKAISRTALFAVEGERRHFRRRPDRSRAGLCANIPPGSSLCAERRRPLRRLQRLALSRRSRRAFAPSRRTWRVLDGVGTAHPHLAWSAE
jgi:poly(3-hydroxybutyrate) depolymerase